MEQKDYVSVDTTLYGECETKKNYTLYDNYKVVDSIVECFDFLVFYYERHFADAMEKHNQANNWLKSLKPIKKGRKRFFYNLHCSEVLEVPYTFADVCSITNLIENEMRVSGYFRVEDDRISILQKLNEIKESLYLCLGRLNSLESGLDLRFKYNAVYEDYFSAKKITKQTVRNKIKEASEYIQSKLDEMSASFDTLPKEDDLILMRQQLTGVKRDFSLRVRKQKSQLIEQTK